MCMRVWMWEWVWEWVWDCRVALFADERVLDKGPPTPSLLQYSYTSFPFATCPVIRHYV